MRRLLPLLVLAALVVGALVVWPVWADPVRAAPATRFTDGHLLGIALWAEPLRAGTLPSLWTPLVAWPTGADLRPLLWPSALLGALLGPALALSVTFAVVPAFNLLCGWVLGAALDRDVAGRALLGGLLALHPWVVETLANGQVEQAVLGGAALQLAAAVYATRGSAARFAVPGVVTALVGWAAPHVALAGCVLVGLWVVPGLYGGARGRWSLVLAATIAGALAVQAYHAPSFAPGVHVFAPKGSDGRPTALADLPEVATIVGLLLPPRVTGSPPVVHATWLGIVALGAALVAAWRERTARGPLAAGLLLAVLALGPSVTVGSATVPMPWAALAAIAPTVAKSMSAYRMVAGAVIALAIAASVVPRRVSIAVLLCAAAIVEGAVASTRPLPLAAQTVAIDPSRAALGVGTGAVLDLPLAGPECPRGAPHYLLEAAMNGRPVPLQLANPRAGYGAVPGLVGDLTRTVARADCGERLGAILDDLAFSTIVLHYHDRDCPPPRRMPACLTAALGPGQSAEGVTWWDLP